MNSLTFGTSYLAIQQDVMRHCAGSCDLDAGTLQAEAVEWEAAASAVDASALSSVGRMALANTTREFRFYALAAVAFDNGWFDQYVSDLRQAITQGAAAANRLGLISWFDSVMAENGCATWRADLLIPGLDPCTV